MTNIIVIPEEKLESTIKNVVRASLVEHDKEKAANSADVLYTVNQVAKRLKRAHATVKKYVAQGLIKTTKSGLISERALNEYLENS